MNFLYCRRKLNQFVQYLSVKMYETVTLLSVFALTVVFGAHLPPELQPCRVADTNFNECLKSRAETAFDIFASGNKKLRIPPLDPLSMGTFTVEPKPGPINMLQKYSDVVISGLSKAKVPEFTVDLKSLRLFMELVVPEVEAHCKYLMKGQLLVIPVDAEGDLYAKFKNFVIQANATLEVFKKHENEYLRVIYSKISFTPGEGEMKMENLRKGNKQLEEQINQVIKNDPLGFFEAIRPATEQLWSAKLKEIINDVLTKVPKSELFVE